MSDDFKIKAEWVKPADRFNVAILSLNFSGRITREIDGGDANSIYEESSYLVDMIASAASMVHQATVAEAARVVPGLPRMIGQGPLTPSPTWLLERRIAALSTEIASLRDKLAARTAQRDELRRIFDHPPAIPHVLAQAQVRDLIHRDAPATTTGNAIDDGPGF